MQPKHAVRLCEELRRERAPRAPNDMSVEIIDDAGHFVFMDQPVGAAARGAAWGPGAAGRGLRLRGCALPSTLRRRSCTGRPWVGGRRLHTGYILAKRVAA